jgi:hypothetical protein
MSCKNGLRVGLLLAISLGLSGCGTNVFKGLESSSSAREGVQAATAKLDRATTPAQFLEVIEIADAVIASESSSPQEKTDAYIAKGQAILGSQNLSIFDFAARLSEFETGDVPSGEVGDSNDNIIEAFRSILGDIPLDDLVLSADSFNAAATLAGLDLSSLNPAVASVQDTSVMIKSHYFMMGLGNLMMAFAAVSKYVVIDSQGKTLRFTDGYSISDISTILHKLVNVHLVGYSIRISRMAFSYADPLPFNGNAWLEKCENAFTQLERLSRQCEFEDGTYTINSQTYEVGTGVYVHTRNENIKAAMIDIFHAYLR